jgi:glycosyltransferase involved in cell wall biosynthesis
LTCIPALLYFHPIAQPKVSSGTRVRYEADVRADRHTILMVTSSYPRFPGDAIATFMEPIARSVAERGHEVHLVAPWHPDWRRAAVENGVNFHLFRYAPASSLNVFGYAAALRADVRLRASAMAVAPLALVSGARLTRTVARETRASIVHAHWVIPSGVIGLCAAVRRPLVISLHGSDVFVAERHALVRQAARAAFRRAAWVTACSSDLRDRALALGAPAERTTVVPYGVDSDRFAAGSRARAEGRASLRVDGDAPLVFAFGRLVEKKGFRYLIEAAALLQREHPGLRLAIAGEGDLDPVLRACAAAAGVGDRVQWLGAVPQHVIPMLLAAADLAVVPSIHDDAGNVDGLPNTVLEIMASGTPLVTTPVGGIAAVATDGRTARVVPERDAGALACAIDELLREPSARAEIGRAAREQVRFQYSWPRVAEAFESIYERAAG